jgi:ketosteroid isomerase-like protein
MPAIHLNVGRPPRAAAGLKVAARIGVPHPAMSLWRLAAVAAVLSLTACGSREAPDTRGADEKTIRGRETAWSKAAETKDLENYLAFYAEEAVSLPPGRPALSGWNEIGGAVLPLFKDPAFWLTFQTRRVEAARSGDLAFTSGVYAMTWTGDNKRPVSETGKYVRIWKKQFDGSWKVTLDIYNSDLLAPRPVEQ